MKNWKRNCLTAACALAASFLFLGAFGLVTSWGIWRTRSCKLTGVEFPLHEIYATDLSGRGRDAGFYIRVYRLPADIRARLSGPGYDLSDYPLFSGSELGDFTRIKWKNEFPTNEIETHLASYLRRDDMDIEPGAPHEEDFDVKSDADAIRLARRLLEHPDTWYAAWYKSRKTDDGTIWMPDFYFYVMNLEHRLLFLFAMQT